MSLSKYPEMLDLFQVKKDAAFDGDPNGDDVMADDVNALQDAISAIESTLGVKPQGNKLNVGERISLLEGSAALRVPSFLVYLGEADKINGATSVDEAVGHFIKFDHIVLSNSTDSTVPTIISNIKGNRDIKIYGYIDSGMNTANLSISQIQVLIQSWKNMGADGIYCDNFGYESGVSRDRQNQILDSIHQYGMTAILQATDSEKLLTNAYDATLNPMWTAPHIQEGDIYHYQQFAVDTSTSGIYTDTYALVNKMNSLYPHRLALGVSVFATPYIASSTDATLAQQYYEWAHIAALLTSVDGFYPVLEGNGKVTNTAPAYSWTPIAGNWYVSNPVISTDTTTNTFSRETAFGKVILNNANHTYSYQGIYIPYELLRIAANSIDGSLLVDSSIADVKIKNYNGQRLIDSINTDTSTDTINIKKIATFGYGDISATGSIPASVLSANVVDAINAYIGTAKIDQAFIGDLNANKITAGDIDAGRLQANVVSALNLYATTMTATSAQIGEAVIGNLHASKISAGDIDAARLQANVVSAINVNAQGANIQNLNAGNISAGDIASDRIKANVVNAINSYAQNLVAGQAVINSAAIGSLTAQNIQAAVINAINTTTDSATINSAKIGSLSVDNMKAAVVEAINLQATTAQIDQARIGSLDATKITTGDIAAARMTTNAISAINADVTTAQIGSAKIGNLDATKITTGDLDAARITANVVTAINSYAQTMTATSAVINIATVGEMDAQHIQGAVIDAINTNTTNATIGSAKIGQLSVSNMQASVISAINATLETATINQAQIGNLDASKITTGDISAARMTTNAISAINANLTGATIGNAQIGTLGVDNMKAAAVDAVNAYVGTATINAAKIGSLTVDNLKASAISAVNASLETATINAAKIGSLTTDNLKASVVDAINIYTGTATIDSAKIGSLSVDNMKATVVEAVNSYTGTAVIGQGMIGNLDAGKITTGDLAAARLAANVVSAINAKITTATIDNAVVGNLAVSNMQAAVISAVNASLETATIDAAKIGSLTATNIQAEVIKAINASVETATIGAAKIGSLTATNIQAEVIKAINASVETATIATAKIGTLAVDNMKANIVDAVNAYVGTAVIDTGKIANLDASKITTGDLDAARITTNVVSAINADVSTATIGQAKIGNLDATKITAGDINAARMTANVVSAINTYSQNMTANSATISSAVVGTLSASNMQAAVISAINASLETATINNAKIGNLDASHIQAVVIDAINTTTQTATINQAQIGNLDATKITTGDIAAARMTTNAVAAINADISSATIGAAKIGSLTATNIQAEVVKAINASVETATINAAKIGSLTATNIQAEVIKAINASVETATIGAAKIGALSVDNMSANVISAINGTLESATIGAAHIGSLTTDNIKSVVVEAINLNATTATISGAKIGSLDATQITTGSLAAGRLTSSVIQAINASLENAVIGAAKIGTLTAGNIGANTITSDKISTAGLDAGVITSGYISGNRIQARSLSSDVLQSYSITATELASGSVTADAIAAGSITSEALRTGIITAQHISTQGLDAQSIQVYDSKTGQVLIGGGYLRVDGMDVGVVQSDNMIANGLFLTSSSGYGYNRDNPMGEAILGSNDVVQGAHQVWKIDLSTGTAVAKIDIPGKKPVDIAINRFDNKFAYVTVEGNDTLVQLDLTNDVVARDSNGNPITRQMGKGPGRIKYVGEDLKDDKHMFVLDTDPTDANVPDALIVVDTPPTSAYGGLYNHHFITVGQMPYDVIHKDGYTYITNATSGDISVLDMTQPNSMKWGTLYSIPIGAMGTDNYHGGLPGQFGLNETVGGDSAGQYSEQIQNNTMPSMDSHGGYGTTDGTMRTYTPHGIASSSDKDIIYVADYANGELLVLSISGSAPYEAMTGSRKAGNLGEVTVGSGNYNSAPPGMGNSTARVPYWIDSTTPLSNPNSTTGSTSGGMTMSVGEPVFTAMDMNMGGSTSNMGVTSTPPGRNDLAPVSGGGPVTKWVWYRIPVGDSPDMVEVVNGQVIVTLQGSGQVAVIKEQDILNQLSSDRKYYTGFDDFEDMSAEPMWTVNTYMVGSKPQNMDVVGNVVYITLGGQNQVVKFDTTTMTVTQTLNVGPNPTGLQITSDGAYAYVVNHGGTGDLSFVYPDGSYFGDPYLGLEGGIEYQGAEYWAPDRSDWVLDSNGNIQSNSAVEFRINEPFLNEGGYVKLTAHGIDYQYAQIEQDMYNVTNYSNGNNVKSVVGDQLSANSDNTIFYPVEQWLSSPAPSNIKIGSVVVDSTTGASSTVYTAADPTTYTLYYAPDSRVVFTSGTVATGNWVVADYTYQDDKYFKPHNGSALFATENSSSSDFNVNFEIEEFVPKFTSFDNRDTLTKDFTADGISSTYDGIEYSYSAFRYESLSASAVTASGPITVPYNNPSTNQPWTYDVITWPFVTTNDDGGNPYFGPQNDSTQYISVAAAANLGVSISPWVQLELPGTVMVSKCDWFMDWHTTVDLGTYSWTRTFPDGTSQTTNQAYKTYLNPKVELSEDGVVWHTWNTASEFLSSWYGFYNSTDMHQYGSLTMGTKAWPTKYIRVSCDGWEIRDPRDNSVLKSGDSVDINRIKVYGDWDIEYSYTWPTGGPDAGKQIATNGQSFVSSSVPMASIGINLPIEYTTWWYMTYITGPEFGEVAVQMPTMMSSSHTLFQNSPYINKVAHRHIMAFPPSKNIKADDMMGVKAGMHRAVIQQKSGKVTFDRFRFEDFQHYATNSSMISPDGTVSFTRYKIVAKMAKWYVGQGLQSTYGAYDTPRLNPDSGQRDYSVALKYRMRMRAELNVPSGNTAQQQGTAYITSAIFETGQLSTHWRRSESQDSIPGNRIEKWDGNQPGKTGIQHDHIANGAIRGPKIMSAAVMDYHVSPYARIRESKLQLNYPTHSHGMWMTNSNGQKTFFDNKSIIDSISGWGTSGTSTNMARADHLHDDRYVQLSAANTLVGDQTVQGNIAVTGTVDGVDVSDFKAAYDAHVSVPNAPTALTLTENGTTVTVGFTTSTSTQLTEYEIWSSIGDTSHYNLIGLVNQSDITGTTASFIDNTYSRKTTIYYKVYAKNGSVRSTALTGNLALTHTAADPTNLLVVANVDSFDIHYTLPIDKLLDHVEVLVDKNSVDTSLSESTATIVYSGLSSHYTYKIPSSDYDLYHEVWVRSVTRT